MGAGVQRVRGYTMWFEYLDSIAYCLGSLALYLRGAPTLSDFVSVDSEVHFTGLQGKSGFGHGN